MKTDFVIGSRGGTYYAFALNRKATAFLCSRGGLCNDNFPELISVLWIGGYTFKFEKSLTVDPMIGVRLP